VLNEPESHIRRAIILCTCSYTHPDDNPAGWLVSGMVGMVRTIFNYMYTEMGAIGTITAQQPIDKLEWTIFR
jgi:hypothetical protein